MLGCMNGFVKPVGRHDGVALSRLIGLSRHEDVTVVANLLLLACLVCDKAKFVWCSARDFAR